MKRHLRAERGTAALELALVSTLVLALLAFSAPLVFAFQERIVLERVAGHTARFATSAPDRPRYGAAKRRPSITEVQAEAQRAFAAAGGTGTIDVLVDKSPQVARVGEQITITIEKTVDLGAFGPILGGANSALDLSVNAVGRQE